jgi:hypothetical protein
MTVEGVDKDRRRCSLHGIELNAAGVCDECSRVIAVSPAVAVSVFDSDEGEYQRWLDGHRRGYVINILRGLNPKEAILHCADCDSISDPTTPYVTHDYVKVCGDRRAEIDEWAIRELGSKIPPCQICFGF